jgi:hypothetical protein
MSATRLLKGTLGSSNTISNDSVGGISDADAAGKWPREIGLGEASHMITNTPAIGNTL